MAIILSERRDSTEDDSTHAAAANLRHAPTGPSGSLTLAFERGRPRAASSLTLADVHAVTIGRSSHTLDATASLVEGVRRLNIQVQDRWSSQVHAHMRHVEDGWTLEDAGSKNGTRVNGAVVDRVKLRHGDLIEVGRSFFVFRQDQPVEGSGRSSAVPSGLLSNNPGLTTQFARLAMLAPSTQSVLILGETGTGKELVAKAIHNLSGRRGSFCAINCGSISRSLLEAELFGYRKGAFSGATEDRPGLIRSADNGTLFLDEIGDLPFEQQTALLRVLQEGEVVPVGAVNAVPVDLRVVAATHRDLHAMIAGGRFREDLLARLNGFAVELPRLRDRPEDLGGLILRLIERHNPEAAESVEFSPAAIRALFLHPWPSNIRQLEQALRAALTLAQSGPIELEHLENSLRWGSTVAPSALSRLRDERSAGDQKSVLTTLLSRHSGNVSAVASEMGTSRMQVHRLCKRLGVDLRDYRPPL
jgi:DNA-binding NtrC family response regulator